MGPDAMTIVYWMMSFKPTFSLSSFTFIKRLFSSSLLSAIRVVSFACLRLLIFLPTILIPAYVSSSLAFLMMQTRHLTCLSRNLYSGQEATVRTGHGPTDWFQRGKGVRQGCILSPCLFNFYAEYIMQNAGLDEAQAGIKIVGRNINNLRHANDTTLMAESKEELNSERWKKRVGKPGLKLNIQKTKIMASRPITSWQTDGETMETVTVNFLRLQNHCRWWLQPWN